MIGKQLLHYHIETQLGAGGMGEVYQARDTKLGRGVAVKILPEIFAHDLERVARFEREAKLLAALNHSNIAALYGLEQVDGRHFLVMELVEGDTRNQDYERADTCGRSAKDRAPGRGSARSRARKGRDPSRSQARQCEDHA